jgi:drug/metabolite transporter (DMT)-like permease
MIPLAFALAFGATICWGLSQIAGKLALKSVEVSVLNAVRTSFASALVVLYFLSTEGFGHVRAELILVVALTGVIGWAAAAMLFSTSIVELL